jgi:hypothetical protein
LFVLDEALADVPAELHQVALLLSLVEGEEHVGPVQGLDSLDGHEVGITGTDTDNEELSHGLPLQSEIPDVKQVR